MSHYGRAQRGGPWGEGWLGLFPPACIDASDQDRKWLGWAVEAEDSSSTSLLLKPIGSSEWGVMTRGHCSRRETTVIKAREKRVICELGQLAHQPLPFTVVLAVPSGECRLPAGLHTASQAKSNWWSEAGNNSHWTLSGMKFCFKKTFIYLYLIFSSQQAPILSRHRYC